MTGYKRIRRFTKKEYRMHGILWGFYTAIWLVMFYNAVGQYRYMFLLTLCIVVPQMAVVYAGVYFFIPKFLNGKQRVKDILLFLGMAIVLYFIAYKVYLLTFDLYPEPEPVPESALNVYFQALVVVILSFFPGSILFMYESLKQQHAGEQLEKEKIQTELKFLRTQINPHFLFNALNSIYHLISRDPAEAQTYMMVFSDMLKYQLYDTQNDFVPLAKELEYIRHYATMEKLRKGKSLEICLDIEPVYYVEIPGLLLLTLTENAFKHVSNRTDASNRVVFTLVQDLSSLRVTVGNTTEPVTGQGLEAQSGIGLENIRRRLELSYQDRFVLYTRRKEAYFEVELILNAL